ncbi:MAG: 3-hydroxybutyrate dehydrogenase, partial [Reinekea sp.]
FNAVCPGYVDTDIVRNQIPGLMRRFDTDEAGAIAAIAKGNRHHRLLHVDETTATTMWLCSDGARSIDGQTIQISGGQI